MSENNILQFKDRLNNDASVYPRTKHFAVVDDNEKTLDKYIAEYNVNRLYPGATDSSVYTLATAIEKLPAIYKHAGIKLTFHTGDGIYKTYMCNSGDGTQESDYVDVSKESQFSPFDKGSGNNSAILKGSGSTASGEFSVALGKNSAAVHDRDFVEGEGTTASGYDSHAEGYQTEATGFASHAEGNGTHATDNDSHAEGLQTTASGFASHAEGQETTASGGWAHAEGYHSTASNYASHAEGRNTIANGDSSHAEGDSTTASGETSHAEGQHTTAYGEASHAEGLATEANGAASHAEGMSTEASGYAAHAEGSFTKATQDYSHTEGLSTEANGAASHAEGSSTIASGLHSHAEGLSTEANGVASHAEGNSPKAIGDYSHAEGSSTIASGLHSHAEGSNNTASGESSHAEGARTTASANHSHAGGFASEVSSPRGFVHGRNVEAKSNVEGQFAVGKYNKSNTGQIASVGIGTSDNNRKNAFEIMQNGDIYVVGLGGYDGTNAGVAGVQTLQQLLGRGIILNQTDTVVSEDVYTVLSLVDEVPLSISVLIKRVGSNYTQINPVIDIIKYSDNILIRFIRTDVNDCKINFWKIYDGTAQNPYSISKSTKTIQYVTSFGASFDDE